MTRLSGFDFRPGFGIEGLSFGLSSAEVRERTAGLLSAVQPVGKERWHADLRGTGTTLQFIGPDDSDARFSFAFTTHHAATFDGRPLIDRPWEEVGAEFKRRFGEPSPSGDSFDWAWESVWLEVAVDRGRVAEFALGDAGGITPTESMSLCWLSLADKVTAPHQRSTSLPPVDIVPGEGAGPVRFGMTLDEVAAAAGPLATDDAAEGEYWSDSLRLRCGFSNGRCTLVASGSPWVTLAGRHVVGQPTDAVLRALPDANGWRRKAYWETLETVENPRLGVTLWSDAAFSREVWAENDDS